MAIFYRTILPSGIAIKYRELSSQEGAIMQRKISALKGDDITRALHTLAASIVAFTRPLALKFVQTPKLGADGEPLKSPDGTPTGEQIDSDEVDVDATLNATVDKDWIAVTFDPTNAAATGGIYDVFKRMPDFNKALEAVDIALGVSIKSRSLLSGKAQLVSEEH
jgi:hypothetical protein